MIVIESRHIIDAIKESCPVVINYSLNRIVLNYNSSNSSFGFARFEGINEENQKEITCALWVSLMPEMSELVIKWLGSEKPFTIEL